MKSIRWVIFTPTIMLLFGFIFVWQATTLIRAIPCEQLVDSRLKTLDIAVTELGDEEYWINNNFIFNGLKEYGDTDRPTWIWYSLTKKYYLHRSGKAIWLDQFWRFSTVQIDDALRCLGEPDAYLSFGETGPDAVLYTLGLLYEKEGYMVTAQYFYTTPEPLPVTGETPLFYIGFHPPASAEQIIARRYDETLAEAVRPWPGDIRQIEVPTIYVR